MQLSIHEPGKPYDDKDIIQIAYLMASSGNKSKIERETGVSRQTIRSWALNSEVYNEALAEARQEISQEILADNLENARLAGNELRDRIVNGDTRLLSNGKTMVIPMGGKDLAVINGIQIDKGRVALGQATSISGSSNTAQMQALADQFARLSRDHRAIQDTVIAVQGPKVE